MPNQKRIIKKDVGSRGRAGRTAAEKKATSGSSGIMARRNAYVPKDGGGKVDAHCPSCGAVYFDKHWHAAELVSATAGAARERLCDACKAKAMRDKGRVVNFGGEVAVSGVRDADERAELLGLVRNVGNRAMRRDPQDRVIHIGTTPDGFIVDTSENQLAVSIGKQLHRARKGSELTITWSHGDKPVRVRLAL